MPTATQLLQMVDTEYRNSYTLTQKLMWMNMVQGQIFQKAPQEALPYQFETVQTYSAYPLPANCEQDDIKTVTIETKAGSGKYGTLEFISITSNQTVGEDTPFYTIQARNFILNPEPTAANEGRKINLIYNKRPTPIADDNLDAVPDLQEDFHELLVLGVMERIARARGEIEDKNNFAADFNVMLNEYIMQYKLRQPNYYTPKMTTGFRRGNWGGSRQARNSRVSDLIPFND